MISFIYSGLQFEFSQFFTYAFSWFVQYWNILGQRKGPCKISSNQNGIHIHLM